MRELLPDNMALTERLKALPRSAQQPQGHAQREVDSILTWACAFLVYMAVLHEAHPGKTKGLIAYMHNLIGEARRNERFSWRNYDAIFRKNAAADPERDWSRLDHSLHAACLSGASESGCRSRLCSICSSADHTAVSCALKSVQEPLTPAPGSRPLPPGGRASPPARERKVCMSWNRGKCAFPGLCSYAHICATCRSTAHPAKDCVATPADCVATPADSAFRHPPPPPRQRT